MSEVETYVGSRIKAFRRGQGLTLQQLADRIYKSKATVSKYESGEIVIDIDTLYQIARALNVPLNSLTDYQDPNKAPEVNPTAPPTNAGSFFKADRLYFYFYDGRYHRLKDGIIDIHRTERDSGMCDASLSISAVTPSGRTSMLYYTGKVLYSDMLIRFTFSNQFSALEEALLYIFNPLEIRDFTLGILCSISSSDLCPCAIKCMITLSPQKPDEKLKQQLMLTKGDIQRWKKSNMWLIDNKG